MSELSEQLQDFLATLLPAAQSVHDKISRVDAGLLSHDEAILRQIEDTITRTQVRRVHIHARMTELAKLIGIVPARQMDAPEPVAAPIKYPRVLGGAL